MNHAMSKRTSDHDSDLSTVRWISVKSFGMMCVKALVQVTCTDYTPHPADRELREVE